MPARPHTPHHVVVLAFDGIQVLDVTGPVDAFASANTFDARYRITTASIDGTDVVTSSGTRLGMDIAAAAIGDPVDTLLVPGAPDWQAVISDVQLIDTVRALSERSARTVSICAGAFPLAATGLLDGRRAATHWKLVKHLTARFPAVRVDAGALFVSDGKYVTSAGVTAGIDLTLFLIEQDYGAAIAREVARDLVVFMARPGDQSQFSARLDALPTSNSVVRIVMDLVTADPQANHSQTSLAAAAGVSTRHLSRLFLAETGHSPTYFVDRTRLEAACALLVAGNDPLDLVAARTGVGSAETLRRLFLRELGVTPATYRKRFRSTTQR
ncbi:GlxA family transcriptional regulator [Mycolicibacterium komossense]|uniref:DJ-1/PfpI family protein n=1 Tax=Mycolicibacterium komossense TaxID=1779 RepID=A0ABT3CGD9_9MYCO|nr:DJ-1/PfpI family protein [Mycolicibacterium komossense]MCV7228447.1 DJ-1/PfpI family protein [Mycolicibacterium komossense]